MSSEYSEKLERELEHYKDVEAVHILPESQHYVNNAHLRPLLLSRFPYGSFPEMVVHYYKMIKTYKSDQTLEVLSLGSGNCELEISLLSDDELDCRMTCVELNPDMLDRASETARERGVANRLRLVRGDINKLELHQTYDLVIGYYALHHFVELELIFDQIHEHMGDGSFFLVADMIGRNGHMFWDATLDCCNRFWSLLPRNQKYNHLIKEFWKERPQWDCSVDGFEGIRAQDILPLLDRRFRFRDFAPFYSLVNRFTDRDFGPNFDPKDPLNKALLDYVWQLDHFCCGKRILKPTQMLACMMRRDSSIPKGETLYFDRPSDVYQLEDSRFYECFDHIHEEPQPEDAKRRPRTLAIGQNKYRRGWGRRGRRV